MSDNSNARAVLRSTVGPNIKQYFQPPEKTRLEYPCIIYSVSNFDKDMASNKSYRLRKAYKVQLIHTDPNNIEAEKLAELPLCKPGSVYVADNLYHYNYTIYL